MGDPVVAANFVEMRRVTSELADVDRALAEAEDAWLRARGAGAVTTGTRATRAAIGITGPIGCGKSQVGALAGGAAARASSTRTRSPAR